MGKKFRVREFSDHKSLGLFMDTAGAAVQVVNICQSSSASFILFSYDDDDTIGAITLEDFEHRGAGRGFCHVPSIVTQVPDRFVKTIDIKTNSIVPVDGFRPARIENGVVIPPTTDAEVEVSQRQAAKDAKIKAAEEALKALKEEP